MKAPVLFRYLRSQRQPAAPRVRRINSALGTYFGHPLIESYLNALACRDGLISADDDSDRHFEDAITIVASSMREGFVAAFRSSHAKLSPFEKASLRDRTLIEFRTRLVSRLIRVVPSESIIESYFKLAQEYALPGREWLHLDDFHKIDEAQRLFRDVLTRTLTLTSLSVREQLRIEGAVLEAFHQASFAITKEWCVALNKATKDAHELGYSNGTTDQLENRIEGLRNVVK